MNSRKLVGYGLAIAILSSLLSVLVYAQIKPPQRSPGLQPFTPTRIEWFTTTLQASLRQKDDTGGFDLNITSPDSETVLIYVRYRPDVNREAMNHSIATARKVIGSTAKSYGWDTWVKIREDVQLQRVTTP